MGCSRAPFASPSLLPPFSPGGSLAAGPGREGSGGVRRPAQALSGGLGPGAPVGPPHLAEPHRRKRRLIRPAARAVCALSVPLALLAGIVALFAHPSPRLRAYWPPPVPVSGPVVCAGCSVCLFRARSAPGLAACAPIAAIIRLSEPLPFPPLADYPSSKDEISSQRGTEAGIFPGSWAPGLRPRLRARRSVVASGSRPPSSLALYVPGLRIGPV